MPLYSTIAAAFKESMPGDFARADFEGDGRYAEQWKQDIAYVALALQREDQHFSMATFLEGCGAIDSPFSEAYVHSLMNHETITNETRR